MNVLKDVPFDNFNKMCRFNSYKSSQLATKGAD